MGRNNLTLYSALNILFEFVDNNTYLGDLAYG